MADYSEQQLIGALRKADAAGDTEAARAIARRIQSMRQSVQPAADFSGVTVSTDSTATRLRHDDGRLNEAGWQQQIDEQAARAPKGNAFTRTVGDLGGRQVMQGVAGLAGALGLDAANHYLVNPALRAVGLGEHQALPYREEASRFADKLGMRAPQTGQERVISDVGEALAGTGATLGIGGLLNLGKAAASPLGNLLTAQPALQTISAATGAGAASTTRESGGSEGRQLAAGLIGGLSPGAATASGAATLRGAVRGGSGAGMQQVIDDFAKAGATPSVGQASGRWHTQGVENLLAGGPTSTGVMTRFAGKQADDMAQGLGRMADDLSRNASGERAGRAISRGVDAFTKNFRQKQGELYDKLDEFVPANQGIDITNTREAIGALNAPIGGAPNTSRLFQNSRIAGIGSALEKDLAIPTDAQKALDDALAKIDALYASRNSATQDAGRFGAFANEQTNLIDQFYPTPGQPRIAGRYSPSVQRAQEGADAASEATGISRGRAAQAQAIEKTLGDLSAAAAAAGGKLPYEAIKKLRTLVGQEIDDAGLMSDFPRSKFNALYKALSNDLEGAARAAGPNASQAWSRANNYTKFGMGRMESIASVIDKAGGPEKVFQAAMAGTRDGGTTLRAVMQSLPPDGQRAVTAAVIKRMGMPTPGQAGVDVAEEFSAGTFMTNWNRVSPEAKRALFDRHGPGFTAAMDRLARVADTIKQGGKVYQNPSGTANRAAALTYGGALIGSLFTGGTGLLLGSGLAANVMARAMTNPEVVKRLAQATALPKGAIPGFIQSMVIAGERSGDSDLLEVARELENRVQEGRYTDSQQ